MIWLVGLALAAAGLLLGWSLSVASAATAREIERPGRPVGLAATGPAFLDARELERERTMAEIRRCAEHQW